MNNTAIVSVQEQKQLQLLNNGLITADRFINKNYLINISEQNIVPLNDYEKTTNSIRLFQIIKLVYDKTENINDKLISVYSALQNVDSSALLVINGNGKEVTFYIGIRSVDNAATASKILEKSFVGNFPGSTLRSMKNGEIAEVMETVAKTENYNTSRNVSCVTVRDIDFFCETLLNVSGTKNLFDIIETTIKKSEVEDEKYDKSSVVKWKSRFRSELTKYVDLPDNFNNTILKYLIHAQELEQNGIDYFEVKRILY